MATSRPIDEKIVAMKMDNSDLVKKASETTSIFGKLTTALNKIPGVNLGRTAKDLGNIQKNIDSTNLDGLASSLNTISGRFTNLGVVATTALTNITNRAVNAGMALSKSLGVDQISDGFREYEMKMGSIGTMLANTEWAGSTLGDVKKTLGELNDYADKTVYSFAQMTQNIGRFTAAGVTLGDSTTAIKGLGNLAAVSGSTSDQLNTAMYQMSQALASGKLTLMDWNSMTNAGMGGKKTQDALVATARAMGKNVDMSEGFRNSIQKGWLTSEVLLETLKKFGEDESMTKAATSVRTFTGMMASLKEGIGSGWAETWEHIFGDFQEATAFWTKMSTGISGWFKKSSDARNKLIGDVADAGGFANIFQGIQNAIIPVVQLFEAVGNAFRAAFPPANFVKITAMTASFRSFTAGLAFSGGTLENITTILKAVFSIFSAVWEIVKRVAGVFLTLLPNSISGVGGGLLGLVANLAEMVIGFTEAFKKSELLDKAFTVLAGALQIIVTVITYAIGFIVALADSLNLVENGSKALDWIASALAPIGAFIKGAFGGGEIGEANAQLTTMKDLLSPISNFFHGIFEAVGTGWEKIKELFSGIGEFFSGFGEKIAENQGWILAGGGMTALGIMVWKVFEIFNNISGFLEGMSEGLQNLGDTIGAIKWSMHANSLLTVAIALGVMAISLKILDDVSWSTIGPGLNGLIFSLAAAVGAVTILNKYNITGTMGATLAIIGMASAMAILATALDDIEKLDPVELGKGILTIGVMMGLMAGSIALMGKFGGKLGTSSLQFLAIAAAVHILISAVKKIIDIDKEEFMYGLKMLGLILLELGLFAKLSGGTGMISTGAGVLMIAAAVNALLIPIKLLSMMDIEKLVQGIGSIAVLLLAIAGASKLMGGSGLIAGAGIMLIAFALNMLLVPITAFSLMSWGALLKGIAGLALVLIAVGGAALLLTPTVVPLIAFGAAIAVLGLGMLAAGAGMTMFAKGLIILAGLTAGAVLAIVGALAGLITGFVTLIPAMTDLAMKLMDAFLKVLVRNIPKIADTLAKLLLIILAKIAEYIPQFQAAVVKIITTLLNGIAENMPKVVESATNLMFTFIDTLTQAVRTNGPRLTDSVLELMGSIMLVVIDAGTKMVTALYGWIPGVKKAAKEVGKNAEKYIKENFEVEALGEEKGEGFQKGINSKQKDINKSGKVIAEAGKKGAESVDMDDSGKNFTIGFANGITSKQDLVSRAASGLATTASSKIESQLDIHSPSRVTHRLGEEVGNGFNNGIASKKPDVEKTSGSLGDAAAKGIEKKKPKAKKAGKSLAEAANEAYRKALEMADYRLEMEEIDDNKYLKILEQLRKQYSKYPEIVRELNLKIKRLNDDAREKERQAREDAIQKQIDDEQNLFDKRKKLIDDRKYYNTITLEEELQVWIRMTKKYKEGTEKRAEADREVYRLKQELNQKQLDQERSIFDKRMALIDEGKSKNKLSMMQELEALKRLAKKYKEGSEERKEIDERLFQVKKDIHQRLIDINKEYTESVEDANQRLIEGERDLTEAYESAVRDRAKSLVGFVGLFDKVKEASGVTGKELMENLTGQVMSLTTWMNSIKVLSGKGLDEGLIEELRQMGPSAASEIAALNSLTDKELAQYSELWRAKNELARSQAVNELEPLKNETTAKIEELRKATNAELELYKTEWIAQISEIRYGSEEEFVKMETTMTQLGKNAIEGLMAGMSSMTGPLAEEAKKLALSISKTIKDSLKIKSPSRVTMGLGEYVGEGLIVGLTNKAKSVADSAKGLALTAKDSLNKFLQGFDLPIDNNELHFKAVVDFDGFDPNLRGIQPIRLAPDTSFANGLITATKVNLGQNGSKTPATTVVEKSSSNGATVDNSPKQPIVIQSILNGRIIAEETFNDTNQLLYGQSNLDASMRGV